MHHTSKSVKTKKTNKKSPSSNNVTTQSTPSTQTNANSNIVHTVPIRNMGVRVKPHEKATASKRDKARLSKQKASPSPFSRDDDNTTLGQDEITSILPHKQTGIGKNKKVVQVGMGSTVYATQNVPVLSFGGTTHEDDFSNSILSKEQYQRERRRQDEQLMWEKESTQIANLKMELEQSKKAKTTKRAKELLPGIEITPELMEESHRILAQQDAMKKKVPKKGKDLSKFDADGDIDIDDYDAILQQNSRPVVSNNGNDIDTQNDKKKKGTNLTIKNDDVSDDDILGDLPKDKRFWKQNDPEAIEERLTLKEQELVKKIRVRAFQSHQTITRYCNQNGIAHLLPLFDMKAYGQDDDNMGNDNYDNNKNNKLRNKKRGYGNDENSEDHTDYDEFANEAEYQAFNDLANMSDDEYKFDVEVDGVNYNDDDDNLDIDAYSYNDDDDEAGIDPDNEAEFQSNSTQAKLSKLAQKKQQKTTVELGHLAKPSIFVQSQPNHTSQFSLQSFDQLQQSTAKGLRLNAKKFAKDVEGDQNIDKKSLFVHRTRPLLPDATWSELGLNPAIAGKLQSQLITNPTATQKLVIPYMIRKYNQRTGRIYVPPTIAIQDYTGSGKTLAYGLPLISNVDTNVVTKMPPPAVIAAIRALQGTKVANPPPLETEGTPLDEVDPKVRIIQYQDTQTYNNPTGIDPQTNQKINAKNKMLHFAEDFDHDDIAENDVDTLISTRSFIDRISNSVDIFNMTPEEWEQHVFAQEKQEQEMASTRQNQAVRPIPASKSSHNTNRGDQVPDQSITGGLTVDASIFNSRVYSLEAIRLRRKKQIKAHLRKIFPFVPSELLDPDCPQSTLQNIIVVPTKELALQITKELTKANPTVYATDTPLESSHQLYGDKNFYLNPVKGKTTLNVRMATGQIDPILLASLGVFLHKGADKANTDAELSPYNQKRAYNEATGEQIKAPKLTPQQKRQHEADQTAIRPHAFVEFGKGHKFYKEDQAEYRKELRQREKDHVLRVMRLRERQLQGEKLSKYEVGEMETLDAYETRRKNAIEQGLDWDAEAEYAKTIGMNPDGFESAAAEMLDADNDDLLGGEFDYEDDPRKLMQMDDATLIKKLDIFRTDFTKHKMFKSLSQQEQREFKSRLATIMTKAHLKQQDDERKAAVKRIHENQLKQGRPVVNFNPVFTEVADGHVPKEQNKEHFMKEVSDLLMEQMGGEKGDFIEVVREKQPHVIIGTPTTIVNLIKSGAIQLPSTGLSPHQLKSLVFDECDHLARNETSLEHHSLLELLSLPADQSVFVSASMTRDNARLLTRLGRRQDLFINNKKPQIETVTNMMTLPRPKYKQFSDDISEAAYEEAFGLAQDKVNLFNQQIESDPMALNDIVLSSPRAKKDRLKVLTQQLEDDDQREMLIGKIVDTMYKQNFTPIIPEEHFKQSLQQSISRGKLSYTTTSDEFGEVLFLSSEDYKAETQPTQDDLATRATNDQLYDAHALPIPPFVKQYYIAPPRLTNIQQKVGGKEDLRRLKSNSYLKRVLKDNLALDLICQLKLRPLKQGNQATVSYTSNAYQKMLDQHDTQNREMRNDIQQYSQELNTMDNNLMMNKGEKSLNTSGSKKPSKVHTATSVCPGTILVFFNPRREEDMTGLYRQLKETGLNVGLYCGLSDRHQKHEVLTKNETLDVILTNDSLSRGIDFKNLSMVINVDPPRATTTFIHRSGRVGRVGGKFRKAATVVNIVDVVPSDQDQLTQESATTTTKDKNQDGSGDLDIPKQTATYSLLKHAERTNVTVNPWPYMVTHNISRVYLRSLKAIVASDTEKQGIKKHIDRKRKTEEYVKARNVKLHKQGIIQTKDTGLFDLAPGYSDSAFQPQLGKGSQSVAIHRIQAKVNERLRGKNSNPWIQTNEDKKSHKNRHKTIKH